MSPSQQNYLAIIGDIVGSRALPPQERQELQHRFQAALDIVNAEFQPDIAALFLITAGDETQGLLSRPHAFYQILRRIQIELVPYEIVFGVGYGTLTTGIGTHAVGADGPAFHRARDALEQAKAERKAYGKSILREVRLHSDDALRDTVLNAMFLALSVLKSGWSEKQRRILNRLELGAAPKEIAAQLQVPLSNISRTVDSAHFREFEILVESLVTFSRNSFPEARSE